MGFVCGLRFLQLDDSPAEANRDSLCAITCPELLHDVLDVNLYSLFSDEELFRDVSIPVSTGNLTEDFYLTRRQVFVAQMLCELCRHLRGNALFPRVDLANHFSQLFGRHALEHVAAGPRFQGALDFHVAFEGRQHDDARLGEFCADGYHRVDTTLVREPEVHESYVWLVLPKLLNGFPRIGGLRYQQHVRLIVDDRGEALAQQGMIIYAENADLSFFGHRTCSLPDCDFSFCPFPEKSLDNHPPGRSSDRNSKAIWPGTDKSTSVPATARLETLNYPPILSLRSFIPDKPQCPSRPERRS